AALHLALAAVGVGPGDDVILPTLTFAATGEVVTYLGARPVLVDVDPVTSNIDPTAVERAITSRTRAIIAVHFAGAPADMGQLVEIASRHSLYLIEDAAHAFPARIADRAVGTIGDIGAFSFYATKTLTTGEGGMVVTDRDDWADRMRILSL